MIALSFIGLPLYVVYVWIVWSNKFDKKEKGFDVEVEDTIKRELHYKRHSSLVLELSSHISQTPTFSPS